LWGGCYFNACGLHLRSDHRLRIVG
jgi:hypothetical protein